MRGHASTRKGRPSRGPGQVFFTTNLRAPSTSFREKLPISQELCRALFPRIPITPTRSRGGGLSRRLSFPSESNVFVKQVYRHPLAALLIRSFPEEMDLPC